MSRSLPWHRLTSRLSLVTFALVSLLAVPLLRAQSYWTGIPPFATVGGGPDDVNLADNSVHWTFPVLSKTGRGIPLSFGIPRDTTGWVQVSVTGVGIRWSPVFGGGYMPSSPILGYSMSPGTCTDAYGTKHTDYNWTFGSFQDLQDNSHPIAIYISYSNVPQPRGTCPGPQTTGSGMTTDGSGINVTISVGCPTSGGGCTSVTATLRDGSVMNWPFGASPTSTDSNGNRITYNWTSGSLSSITDTLGTAALNYSTNGSASVTASYTSPSGATAPVTITQTAKTIQTSFGCSGVAEYPATSWYMPTKVTLPDGTYYTITYETLSNGNTTGRISSVRIPTGATITYSYAGGTNGINCVDGSVPTMTRTTPDGTWTYTRALTLDQLGRVSYSTNTTSALCSNA